MVLARDGYRCQAPVHAPSCPGSASEVDHIVAGDDHDLANLRALSAECHRAKTAAETSARSRAYAAARRRPCESHPGLVGAPRSSGAAYSSASGSAFVASSRCDSLDSNSSFLADRSSRASGARASAASLLS